MVAPIVACHNHADREAIGVCVKCRIRICSECTTRVDGINHCVSCFAAEAGSPVRSVGADRDSGGWFSALVGVILLGVLAVLTWILLEVALPG